MPSERRKGSVRKDSVPGKIDEGTVKSFKGGGVTVVCPSVSPVQEWQFDQTHGVEAIIEGFSFGVMKILVVLFMGVANHIEIAKKHPGGIGVRCERS